MNRTHDRCECKVGRVIESFGLEGMNEDLAARRRGETDGPASLRDLADYFNREVLRRAMERAGETPLEGEVANNYRLLTDDDVSSGMRIRARKRLESEGVDLDAVEGGFVSHPTMGNHLADCLGVERPTDPAGGVDRARDRIFKMQSRAETVIENTLEGLASAGRVAAGDLAVTVDVRVVCETCGTHSDVGGFVDRGGCDCDRRTDE